MKFEVIGPVVSEKKILMAIQYEIPCLKGQRSSLNFGSYLVIFSFGLKYLLWLKFF